MTLYRWLAVALFTLSLPAAAAAQADAGRISGTVRDQSGAFVANAAVVAKNLRTGETRTANTNEQGFFTISPLKPSAYTVTVNKSGFAPVEYPQMPVAVGQELALDFEFKPAGVEESVSVVGAAPVLDLSSARLGANVSEREVEGLPVNGRQMSQLMLQAPGSQNAGTGTWQDIRFSGRAVEQNVIRYDGIEGSAIIDAAPGNLNGEIPTPFKLQASLENVQEFRVESSAYPAEFGTGTGGQVSVVTKSGSNNFRGALFEYLRDDALDAPNYFDSTRNPDGSVIQQLPKSNLSQNQFGGSFGGPIMKDRAFFFGSYEAYRLNAGLNFVEAVPSDASWAKAVPAIAALRSGFLAAGAVILPGASANPAFDIAQLQADQVVREHALSGRFDYRINGNWTTYARVFHDQGTNDQPEGVTGRTVHITDNPSNAVWTLQGLLGYAVNDFRFGYNAAPTQINGVTPSTTFSNIVLNLSGSVANTGIAGQGATSGLAVPGGLVRANSATNGRGQPYDPYSLTFADSLNLARGNHFMKAGGEFRAIRMATDRLGGTTYSFPSVDAFMANQPNQIQYLGDVSEPSAFNNGATGPRHTKQEYYIGFAQDEWRIKPNVTLNYGLRYDYYTPMREADDLIVKFNIDTGAIDPNTTPLFISKKDNVQPRVSMTYSPKSSTLLRGGFGIFVGPGQGEDQIQPIESDRISSTLSSGAFLAYPVDPAVLRANFNSNSNNRSFQPRAYANDYTVPERIYQYTTSIQQEFGGSMAATVAYVGSQGRNLFLRSVANRTVGVLQTSPTASAAQIREFDIVTCADGNVLDGRTTPLTSSNICTGSTAVSKQSPFAEVDYKTSGGHDTYNALQLSLTRRSTSGLTMNAQYTLGYSKGDTGGSNEATTSGNNARTMAEFDYDDGYNNFDVRHTYNISAIYSLPFGRGKKYMADAGGFAQALVGNWDVGGILNGRSGLPVPVLIQRNDIVYVDAAGLVYNNPAADRVAVVNTPGGGQSRSTRRPDLVPGVDPFIKDGGLIFLNPAAFSTPAPGTFGNLERNSIHGPSIHQIDLVFSKRFDIGNGPSFEFRTEIFNVFNEANFSNPVGTLPNALPNNSATEANKVQPGQAYTTGAAGQFGRITSTVGRTVGLGTNRQIQLGLRLNF